MVAGRLAILRSLILIALSPIVLWGQTDYQKTVQPVLAKNCVSCHSDKLKVANLSLQEYRPEGAVWEKVLEKVSTGRMPPPGAPPLSKADAAVVTGWIEKTFPQTASAVPAA